MNKSKLKNWYSSITGKYVQKQIEDRVLDYLNKSTLNIRDIYVIEMGFLSKNKSLISQAPTKNHTYLVENNLNTLIRKHNKSNVVITDYLHLPIAFDCVEVVIASHLLESTHSPHQALREVNRILTADGHCILIGLNPFSYNNLFNLKNLISILKSYNSFTFSPRRLIRTCDWLNVLGFEILDTQYLGFLPKSNSNKLLKYFSWFDRLNMKWNLPFGKIYIIHAKKRLFSIPPRKFVWKPQSPISGDIAPQPTTRNEN